MAVDNRLMFYPCSFVTRPCENYLCRQSKVGGEYIAKYYIGNPHGSSHNPIYCLDCVKHLVANLPSELVEGGTEFEENLKAEYEKQFAEKLQVAVDEARVELTTSIRHDIMLELAGRAVTIMASASQPDEPEADDEGKTTNEKTGGTDVQVDAVAPDEDKPKKLYRCLDCNKEFDTAQKLGSHRASHKK